MVILIFTVWTDVTVGIHGSSVSGFALLGSNVNINLSIPESEGKKVRNPALRYIVIILKMCVESCPICYERSH